MASTAKRFRGFRLDPSTDKLMRLAAAQRDMSITAFISEAVRDKLEREPVSV